MRAKQKKYKIVLFSSWYEGNPIYWHAEAIHLFRTTHLESILCVCVLQFTCETDIKLPPSLLLLFSARTHSDQPSKNNGRSLVKAERETNPQIRGLLLCGKSFPSL